MSSSKFSVPVKFAPAGQNFQNIWAEYGEPTKKVLPKGWTKDEGRRPLPVDIIWEKDVKIPMRDGVHLLCDIFRPVSSDKEKVPAIMPWSPFGKSGSGQLSLDMFKWRVGIPRSETSGLEKWEAPDPAEWVPRGYALVHIDARGSFKSEGDLAVYGTQEGQDGHDSIEWIAKQPWCNETVAMAGNSWLGTTQWFIAAENPPHLTCMAPWEGVGDFYRETICRGGIPDSSFWALLTGVLIPGSNQREDVAAMIEEHPLENDYWEDKRPKVWNIDVPMYATASYSSSLHTEGSVRGYFLSQSKDKWLRWTHTQEWHDIYQKHYQDDMQRFFDKYMKGIDNGWESTPRIRLSLLGYNKPSIVDRPISAWPPSSFKYRTLYLDSAKGSLAQEQPSDEHSASYDGASDTAEGCTFTHTFSEYTELCGFSKVKLFMSTADHDDMDVFVVIRKLDKDGQPLTHSNMPLKDLGPDVTEADLPDENTWKYVGPNGRLRASHRGGVQQEKIPHLNAEEYKKLMSDAYVWNSHADQKKLSKDEVVELDIGLWPGGIIFDAGESMRLEIKGHRPILPDFEALKHVNYNKGTHVVHTGGKYKSQLYVSLSS